MTEHRNDKRRDELDSRLEALYREAGDVEPDAGLDRIVRARAEEATRTGRSSSRLPWRLGGLVTASVGVLAIAVVLQQSPPGPLRSSGTPEADAPIERSEPEAFMSPSAGADATLKSTTNPRSEVRQMESAGADAPEAAPAPSPSLREPLQPQSEETRAARVDDIVAEQAANVAEPAIPLPEEIADDPDKMLDRIEALIERDEIRRARELLDRFRREYPDRKIPPAMEEALTPSE
ncbi:MAG: hypothetical protein KGY48_07455 [Wenzhouxiangellaceae bacterium]|nr:hypothetical protein [Wenzhouxiangellaceae bacterium]MBS3745790.1 hypothetical protein [Wenzhouxiangellaceae bacterium]MBS3824040.1 hypothetical protein [Wenzhouxiangellaceae bacterium]